MGQQEGGIPLERIHPKLHRKITRRNTSGQPILFLQCPIGPIAQELIDAAREAGYDPVKINFNAGDALYVSDEYAINFQGRPKEWGAFFDSVSGLLAPVAIVLMGDMRFYHKVAIERAKQRGIRVICLEEGYMRPNFVTVELDGVNSNSPLRKNFLAKYRSDTEVGRMRKRTIRNVPPIGSEIFWAVVTATTYYVAKTIGSLRFRHYQHHRKRPVVAEFAMWTRGYFLKFLRVSANNKKILDLVEHRDNQYYVVALQVHDDLQLVCHGRGWSNQLLVSKSIAAFAARAPEHSHLVIKGHPLDRGRFSYTELVPKLAKLAGCENRVHFVDDGSISLLVRHSLGLVTINSTSGISALHHHKPLLALGDALYSIDGLVNPSTADDCIETFFANPQLPDRKMAIAFLDTIEQDILVYGSYYQKSTLKLTARNIIARVSELIGAARAEPANVRQLPGIAAVGDQPERVSKRAG
jgi:capsular polysaccharide export protein